MIKSIQLKMRQSPADNEIQRQSVGLHFLAVSTAYILFSRTPSRTSTEHTHTHT